MSHPITFEIEKRIPGTLGRAGVIRTPHGDIETPAFVVVGTKGTVKSIKPEDMHDYVGNQVALANTYHLFLQPGSDLVKESGGLHKFANWYMPTMTDSGGFQVFSLGAAFGKGVTKFAKGEVSEFSVADSSLEQPVKTDTPTRVKPTNATFTQLNKRISPMSFEHFSKGRGSNPPTRPLV